ncbi:hypothetical protein AQI84_00925 [Streptomyces griseorubiginosus]|nr:hypothetical protein AQI84_00925 [Streptomyces griseorubiginosus]
MDLLDAEEDITVVGEAADVEHALLRAPAVRPHVAVTRHTPARRRRPRQRALIGGVLNDVKNWNGKTW